MECIYDAINREGFSEQTLDIIDNYTKQIVNGSKNFNQFNQAEHAGLCSAGAPLIGASIIASYATRSLAASRDVASSERCVPSNWQVDAHQEKCITQSPNFSTTFCQNEGVIQF